MPGTLTLPGNRHHGACRVTARWLLHYLQILYEELCFRGSRRRLADLLLANAWCAGTARAQVLLQALPTESQLVSLAHVAFKEIVEDRVQTQKRWQNVYNGSGVRLDGGFKKAKIIAGVGAENKTRPYTVLMAFCSVDGSLLTPIVPVRREVFDDIAQVLKPLVRQMIEDRLAYGLPFEQAVPSFISTDSFHVHKNKLQRLVEEASRCLKPWLKTTSRGCYIDINTLIRVRLRAFFCAMQVTQELRLQAVRQPGSLQVRLNIDPDIAHGKSQCVICGEPYHDIIAVRT